MQEHIKKSLRFGSSLEYSGQLIKAVTETIENEI